MSDMSAYYAECWAPRLALAHNQHSHAIHYGLDDLGDAPPDAAKLRTNEHVAERLGLGSGVPRHVVDLGCGVGGTTINFARRWPSSKFIGVDATTTNLELARTLAGRHRVSDAARFVEASFDATGLDERFDGAYAIESLCHAADRQRLAREVFRLLEPGAPFVVVDLFRSERPLDGTATERYFRLRRGYAISDYYDEPFDSVLVRNGWRDASTVDLTERASASIRRSAERARAALDSESVSTRREWHLEACIAASELVESGHLRYRSVRAVRA